MNLIQRALLKILRIETTHPLLTIGIAASLAVLSIGYTIRNLDFQTGQKDLISPNHPLRRLSRQMDGLDDLDTFVVAIENRNTLHSLKFLHELVSELRADQSHYARIFYRIDPEAFKPWALLYLDKEELSALSDNLEEHQAFIQNFAQTPSLTTLLRELNHEMASSMVGELFTGFLKDETLPNGKKPMDLTFLIRILGQMNEWLDGQRRFTSPWATFFTNTDWGNESEEGYFWTENKLYLLVFVTPLKEENSFTNAQKSLTQLRKTIASVQTGFPDIRAGVTGQEALNEDEMDLAFRDMTAATLISLLSLAILLILFWRGFRRPFLEIIELVIALSWTFGFTTVFIGHLNILSITFAPLLLGLGIDYGIHWFARYQEEEQRRGTLKKKAVENTMVRLGPSILLAGITAALSFFPLVLTGFRGLVELGIITSIGMLMTTVTTLCVLPPLTIIFDTSGRKKEIPKSMGRTKSLLSLGNRGAVIVLIPAGVALLLSVWAAKGVKFDLNMLNLQSRKAESVIWEKKLLKDADQASMYGAIFADSLESLHKKTKALEMLPSVSKAVSIQSFLPDDQEEKIPFLKHLKPLLAGTKPIQAAGEPISRPALDDILGRIRFKMIDANTSKWGPDKPLESQMREVRELIDRIQRRFQTRDPKRLLPVLADYETALIRDATDKLEILRINANAVPMTIEDLPRQLHIRYVDTRNRYLIRILPAHNTWEPALLGKFVDDIRSVDPDAIGDPVTLYVFTKAFRDAAIKAAIYAGIFIFLLLLATFRNLVYTLMVMTPLVVGTVWAIGLMRLLGIHFNLANSIFLPLIVGAGVEYGIIIVQRWKLQEKNPHKNTTLPFSTAKGVILAGLTTTVGFGSLAISAHQGIFSLGVLSVIGSLSILAAAILFLPAVVQVWSHTSILRRRRLRLSSAQHHNVCEGK